MSGQTPATLWAKGLPLDQAIHRFTVGEDPQLDLQLLPFDCMGSAAHARMLTEVGLLPWADGQGLVGALAALFPRCQAGQLLIDPALEDGHTALEAALVEMLGESGKRIHLARSRNDQVVLALRLLQRQAMVDLGALLVDLAASLYRFAGQHADQFLPGFTHLRRAMPSSVGQWAVAYVEALIEELDALPAIWQRLDRCPSGSAAGFGVPLAIDRERSAQLLGFSRVQRATIDVQNSRARHSQALLDWLASVALGLEKLCWDLCLYSGEEFGYFALPDAATTGSSIMPNKRNPDVAELGRARCRELYAMAQSHRQIMSGLPSSYHRDFQLGKGPLLAAINLAAELFDVLRRVVDGLQVRSDRADAAMSDDLYAADRASLLAAAGMPFRDAYRQVAAELAAGDFAADRGAANLHTGARGSLALEVAQRELDQAGEWVQAKASALASLPQQVFSLDGWRSPGAAQHKES
ncbi:MAG: argininosuccinate lyase [Xanthomonadales bacterium]|nr:argininosuccinate lyase [Xanthomonadales bacterium]